MQTEVSGPQSTARVAALKGFGVGALVVGLIALVTVAAGRGENDLCRASVQDGRHQACCGEGSGRAAYTEVRLGAGRDRQIATASVDAGLARRLRRGHHA